MSSVTGKGRGKTIVNKQGVLLRTGGMFDLTYFDNSNWRPFVWHLSKVGMFNSGLVWLIRVKN